MATKRVRKSGARGKNVKVKSYRRRKPHGGGVIEEVGGHKRGPRSPTPGGYKRRNWHADRRRRKFRNRR